MDTRTLPWDWYVSADVLAQEQERVFKRAWTYACPAEWVTEPGAYVACNTGDVPLVVVRGRNGALRAFVNVCRHRGSVIASGRGRRETLQCPYHAWTYDLDGTLRKAPRSERESDFRPEELSLRPALVLPRPICGVLRSLGLGWVLQFLQRLGVRPCASP